jgi:hypothetical protein
MGELPSDEQRKPKGPCGNEEPQGKRLCDKIAKDSAETLEDLFREEESKYW